MRNRNDNPLALVPSQVEHSATHGKIDLTNRQVAHLRKNGLLAGPLNWYYSPDGAFALAPIHPASPKREHRKRVNLAPVTSHRTA